MQKRNLEAEKSDDPFRHDIEYWQIFGSILKQDLLNDRNAARQSLAKYNIFIIKQGEAQLHILELTSVFHHLTCVGPKQLCAVAHLGCTREAGTS